MNYLNEQQLEEIRSQVIISLSGLYKVSEVEMKKLAYSDKEIRKIFRGLVREVIDLNLEESMKEQPSEVANESDKIETNITEHLVVGYYSKAVKMIDTKRGVRYYQNSGDRFFPLPKAKFLKLDLSITPVYQELPGMGWMQINEAYKGE